MATKDKLDDEKQVNASETKKDKKAKPWLDLLLDAKKCFENYQDKSDNIDKMYADLERLAGVSVDREFQIFWANLEVLKPSIYARPPIPVVAARFKDREPLPRRAADLLERTLLSDFDQDDIDTTMRAIRDDLATVARGVVWLRYGEDETGERVWAEHVDRRDFLHSPARKWQEVDWVARRVFLTQQQGVKRFGDEFLNASFEERGIGGSDEGDYKGQKKAEVWEIWHKTEKVVVWVSPDTEKVLDIRAPFLDLTGFFPCPRPAYGTLQRRTMIPVPDFVYYKDQIEEINELTARVAALTEALRVKGFYPSGADDVASAIEAAMKTTDNNAVLVPVSNFAALGGASLRESIIWMPVGEIAAVVDQLLQLRRQLIEDVYQITGISDIMRGNTAASETATAQSLKSQYGSIRIRDRQQELVRVARDITRLKGEIMAENFEPETFLSMSQVSDLPTDEEIAQQIQQITQQLEQQVEQAKQNPQLMAMAQKDPQQAQRIVQQVMSQAQEQVAELEAQPTLEKVMDLLRSQKMRTFVLEIETDSTIQPDEDREKQRRTEFLTSVGGFIAQAGPMVEAEPATAPFVAEALKFAAAGFRAGRELDSVIDEFAEMMVETAKQRQQPQGPTPEQQAMQAEAEVQKAELELKQQEAQQNAAKTQADIELINAKVAEIMASLNGAQEAAPSPLEMRAQELEAEKIRVDERKIALDEAKLVSDTEDQKKARLMELRKQNMEAGLPPDHNMATDMEAIEEKMVELKEIAARQMQELIRLQSEQNTDMAAAIAAMTAALTAPKRVVRDDSGRAIGVETENNGV